MRITDIRITRFRTKADRWDVGHGRLKPSVQYQETITCIEGEGGLCGYYIGGPSYGGREGLNATEQELILGRVRDLLIGQDAFDREKFWQWMLVANIPEGVVAVIDLALWDLAGRALGQPVWKLLGGARDKVKAYASTWPNIGQPQAYADHAIACRDRGYKAYKIHPHYFWDPATETPTPGRPSNIAADIETCRLVHEAVGEDMVLMYDVWGTYMSIEDAIKVGRVLEELDFYWFEHPMPEYRVESYVRLCRELSIPVMGPEIAAGGVFTRAEWILRGASDMSRMDVRRGGITACRKTAIVCEAYGIKCEIHMSGWGNLQVMGATSEDTSEYYERGLLAPGIDYDATAPYLRENCDPMDSEGFVTVPTGDGLGFDIVWDYVRDNEVRAA